MPYFSRTRRRKLVLVALTTIIFACLGAATTFALGRPVDLGVANSILVGLSIGLFEEFYVQSEHGVWLRSMHPMRSIFIYIVFVAFHYCPKFVY